MKKNQYLLFVYAVLAGLLIGILISLVAAPRADATVLEAPDREVKKVRVTYAEPDGDRRHPNRHFFETNDGGFYVYKGNRACERANDVPNRVCHTVFWYAR